MGFPLSHQSWIFGRLSGIWVEFFDYGWNEENLSSSRMIRLRNGCRGCRNCAVKNCLERFATNTVRAKKCAAKIPSLVSNTCKIQLAEL
jgi:hypothetical protein